MVAQCNCKRHKTFGGSWHRRGLPSVGSPGNYWSVPGFRRRNVRNPGSWSVNNNWKFRIMDRFLPCYVWIESNFVQPGQSNLPRHEWGQIMDNGPILRWTVKWKRISTSLPIERRNVEISQIFSYRSTFNWAHYGKIWKFYIFLGSHRVQRPKSTYC